jgi:hypothetical protein
MKDEQKNKKQLVEELSKFKMKKNHGCRYTLY